MPRDARAALSTSFLVLTLIAATAPDARAGAVRVVAANAGAARRASPRVRDALSGEAVAAFDRASALFEDGDYNGARAEFLRAHALSGEPRVLYNVAVCDKGLRQYARAVRHLEDSLREGGATLPKSYVSTVNDTIALLQPFVTQLTVTSKPAGATVLVDDEPAGTTPLAAPIAVDVGEHRVVVRKVGYQDFVARVQTASGAASVVDAPLAPAVSRGELRVTASRLAPNAAAVAVVDGVEVGPVPWSGRVDAGSHAVTVRAPGAVAKVAAVEVPIDGQASLDVEVTPHAGEGRLRVHTEDARNEIRLDGNVVGHGDLDLRVPSGEHTLRVSRPGAEPNVSEVVIRDGETRALSIQLSSRSEIPAWVWIAGGIVVAGAATATVVYFTSRTTKYEGATPGTLDPKTVPAGIAF